MKKFNLITAILLLWGIISNLTGYNFVIAQTQQNKDKNLQLDARPTCYSISIDSMDKMEKVNLNQKLELLEKQYKDKKIDQKTYKTSKESLLKDLNRLKEKK